MSSPRSSRFVKPLVDPGCFRHPPLPLLVVEPHDFLVGPVEVKGQVRYLLVQPVGGVARYSPRLATSTSNSPSQCGQVTCSRVCPFWLIRW